MDVTLLHAHTKISKKGEIAMEWLQLMAFTVWAAVFTGVLFKIFTFKEEDNE